MITRVNITNRKTFLSAVLVAITLTSFGQQTSKVREYSKVFPTYPFSDPDPVPEFGKIYPYYRFDGYTDKPVNKEWKIVELENDYIKVMIMPEIGGKIWAAIEKSTGKSFIYYNHVVKFRDVAMRGPWTSGGIEANYGIVGHTPNCATPVDYTVINKEDGSVSCVIGVLDLLTRTNWRIDINLEKDKAYFTTSSFWYNSSGIEQPYYTWMNAALKTKGNLQFIYPGTRYLGHAGEYSDWPVDKKGRDLSYYENNNFGGYKSYHVFGKRTDFFGAYYHDEDMGMARYSTYDDKPGKKIWIWGLSQQGMIWEKLLSDTDGQYVEVQSGRLFIQPMNSSLTPFKNRGFLPDVSDTWKEYWFPVLGTKGFVAADSYGALNIKKNEGNLKIYFSPVQSIKDELTVRSGEKIIYSKKLDLKPLELFSDSVALAGDTTNLSVRLGQDKMIYEIAPETNALSRPVAAPEGFDWKSVQGLYLMGKEYIRQRTYVDAELKLRECLRVDPNYLPALTDLSMVLYRQMKYDEALTYSKRALSIDTYDPAANYYYGLINEKAGHVADAKDGFSIASQSIEYRTASFTRLGNISLVQKDFQKAILYARKAIDFNRYALDAYQMLAVINRLQNNRDAAVKVLDTIKAIDPLNHFALFENYLWDSSETNKKQVVGKVTNEMPAQTFLELAVWYYKAGLKDDAARVLKLSPHDVEIIYWRAFLSGKRVDLEGVDPTLVFPFRPETADVLRELISTNDSWLLKYHLALIEWNSNNKTAARKLYDACGDKPAFAPFYASRAKLYDSNDSLHVLTDLQKAKQLDPKQWRYGRALVNYYIAHHQLEKALSEAANDYKNFPSNYIVGMLYIKVLALNEQYGSAEKLINTISILPNEGSTAGRQLYHQLKLSLAVNAIKSKNTKKALQYISEAKLWPERLGSGKPYNEDTDERLEDWLTYLTNKQSGNKDASGKSLDRILTYKQLNDTESPSVNDLITALALKEVNRGQEADKYLSGIAVKYTDDPIAKWLVAEYNNKQYPLPDVLMESDTYIILKELKK